MRDYARIDGYRLNKLAGDIYLQPEDDGHKNLSLKVISHWMSRLTSCKSVLDLGCGTGFCQQYFEQAGCSYEGICLGGDYLAAQELGRNVRKMDFSFLEYDDISFDLLFSRHSLEHSPFPLLTLMEWRRVSKQWLGIVLPSVEWYGYKGQNHYHVLNVEQWRQLLDVAGWNIIWDENDSLPMDVRNPEALTVHEYRIFCEKK